MCIDRGRRVRCIILVKVVEKKHACEEYLDYRKGGPRRKYRVRKCET